MIKLENEQIDPVNSSEPFYDGKGYLRIPGDDYYDKKGRLHKMGEPVEITKERIKRQELEIKQKKIAEIKIIVKIKAD